MLSRAERTTAITVQSSTNEHVGPGSYSVPEPPDQTFGPSSAFGTSKRSTLAVSAPAARDEQAPCADDAGGVPVRPWTSSNTSSYFASSTQRFVLDKEAVAKPGPGAYQTSPKWVKQQLAGQLQGGKAGVQHSSSAALTGGAAVRAPAPTAAAAGPTRHAELLLSTPPSIPARHQSFGYEPGPDGQLVMQPPPAASSWEGDAGKGAASAGSSSNKNKSKPTTRPNTAQLNRKLQKAAAAAVGNSDGAGTSSSSSGNARRPAVQSQQAQHSPPAAAQEEKGSHSPRFRCTAGGKLVLGYQACGRAGSAAFASKSARLHQQEPDPDKLTPGPGTYTTSAPAHRPASAPAHTAPPPPPASRAFPPGSPRPHTHQPLFARTAGRAAALSIGPGWSLLPSKSLAPGPGAYDLAPSVAADCAVTRVCCRSNQGSKPVSGLAAGPAAAAAAAAAAGFGRTSKRFGDDSTVSPGPGKYTADQLMSMAADAARRAAAASRRGAFGSAAGGRPHSFLDDCLGLSSGSSSGGGGGAPGPGCYDVRCGLADRAAAVAERPSVGFASCSERFTAAAAPVAAPDYSSFDGTTLRGDQARLGPGAYLQLDDWRRGTAAGAGRCGYHTTPFGSESRRKGVVEVAAADSAPGPGAYAAVDVHKVFQPLSIPGKAGFCTTSQRFRLHAATPKTVGPGTYSQQSSLIRPTFNVTLDQP